MPKKLATTRIAILERNLPSLSFIIDKAKRLGVQQIKFVLPFKVHKDDGVPLLAEAVPNIAMARNYAKNKGIKVLVDSKLEDNPYLPKDGDFLDTGKVKAKINFKKHKNKPRFSIIIPAFNKKDSLKFVLHNFLNQDYPKSKFEIIVVDDGSSDKTLESIKKVKPICNFKYFYWPRKKMKVSGYSQKWAKFYNRVGLARNIGVNHAQGEIILFNDADILVAKDCLKKHEAYHGKHSNIIVRGFRMFLPERFSLSFKKAENFNFLEEMSNPEKIGRVKRLHCRMHDLPSEGWQRFIPANLSIRKKYLAQAGGFSHDSPFWGYEDIELGYRLSQLKMKLMWDDKIKVYHLHHPSQTGDEINTLAVMWINLNILYRKYLDEKIYNIYRDVILYRLDKLILE